MVRLRLIIDTVTVLHRTRKLEPMLQPARTLLSDHESRDKVQTDFLWYYISKVQNNKNNTN